MRNLIKLVEQAISQKTEVRGSHSGQMDMTLSFNKGDQIVGYIDYSVYQGDVHIQMIKVRPEYRRQGFGSDMLRALQQEYPETEINVGGTTEDGQAMISAMKTKEIPNGDIGEKKQELEEIRGKIAALKQRHDELVASQNEPGFDERRIAFIDDVGDQWNELADREWELMQEIGDQSATRRIFENEFPF